MNDDNKINSNVIKFAAIFVTLFVLFFVVASYLGIECGYVYLLLCAIGGYLTYHKKQKGVSSYREIVIERKNAYFNSIRHERKVQLITIVGVVFVCLMVNNWWSTPNRLRLKVYEAIGSVNELCTLYEDAYENNKKDLLYDVAEALSKFNNKESRAFLGEILISDKELDVKEKVLNSLYNNDRDSLKLIIDSHKNDGQALIDLFKLFNGKKETANESVMCIDALVEIDYSFVDDFLNYLLLSSDELRTMVIKAYEKSSAYVFETKLIGLSPYHKRNYAFYVNNKNILEALAHSEKYRTKVADTILSSAVYSMNFTDVQYNLEMVDLIEKHIGDASDVDKNVKDKALILIDKFKVVSQKYKDVIKQHSVQEKEVYKPVQELEKELASRESSKYSRLEELSMFFQYTVPMYEDYSFRQGLVEQFGVQRAWENIKEYQRMYWENKSELNEINSDFAALRRKIASLKAECQEKMSVHNEELFECKGKYELYVNKFKSFSWREVQSDKQESLKGVCLGMPVTDALRIAGKPNSVDAREAEFTGWSFQIRDWVVSSIVLGDEKSNTGHGLKFDKSGLMNAIDDSNDDLRLVKEGLAEKYFYVNDRGRITNYLKLNSGEVFLLDYPCITLIKKLPKGAQIDNRTF